MSLVVVISIFTRLILKMTRMLSEVVCLITFMVFEVGNSRASSLSMFIQFFLHTNSVYVVSMISVDLSQ